MFFCDVLSVSRLITIIYKRNLNTILIVQCAIFYTRCFKSKVCFKEGPDVVLNAHCFKSILNDRLSKKPGVSVDGKMVRDMFATRRKLGSSTSTFLNCQRAFRRSFSPKMSPGPKRHSWSTTLLERARMVHGCCFRRTLRSLH